MAIILQDALDYLGIDFSDDTQINANVNAAINASEAYLKGAIGEDADLSDPRAETLAKMVISDLYYQRGTTETPSPTVRRLVSDFILQLKCEELRKNDSSI